MMKRKFISTPPHRRRNACLAAATLCAVLLPAIGILYAQAPPAALEGRVINGTTNKPVAKAEVRFVLMAQGMSPAATQVTDAQGNFRFDHPPSSGGGPALLRVDYQGATYSQPVLPQHSPSDKFELQVFDAGHDPKSVTEKEHAIFLHPSGNTMVVLEQIIVGNGSVPPKTYVNADGTVPFTLAGKPHEKVQVTVVGPGGMPIGQNPDSKEGDNRFAITYPIRPGETQVRLEYTLDYHSPFQFSKTLDLPAEQVHMVTPGSQVQLSGDGLTSLGADPSTGFVGYKVIPNGNLVRLEVSGDAPARPGELSQSADGEAAALLPIPDPMSARRWIILTAAGLVMLAGFVYHYKHG